MSSPQYSSLKRPLSHYLNGLKQFLAYKMPKVLFVEPGMVKAVLALVQEAVENGAGSTRVVVSPVADVRREFGQASAPRAPHAHTPALPAPCT
jgi:hypothetical protein